MGNLNSADNPIVFDDSPFDTGELWLNYQPIVVPQSRHLVGFEALLRSSDTPESCPLEFLAAVRASNRTDALGHAIRTHIAASISALPKRTSLFVNLEAADLQNDTLYGDEEPLTPFANRIVFEITERTGGLNERDLNRRIAKLRARNFRVALDDLGAGHNGLALLSSIKLDLVKLDMALVRNVNQFESKQSLIALLIEFCHQHDIQCLAEGIESEAEHVWLSSRSIDLAQGFLYGRAAPLNQKCLPVPRTLCGPSVTHQPNQNGPSRSRSRIATYQLEKRRSII